MEGIAACMTKNSFGWKFVVGFIISVTLLFKSTVGGAASIEQNSSVQFAVTDPRTEINESLSPHLALKIRGSVDAQGRRYGWDIAVIDWRLAAHPNVLHDCLCVNGT